MIIITARQNNKEGHIENTKPQGKLKFIDSSFGAITIDTLVFQTLIYKDTLNAFYGNIFYGKTDKNRCSKRYYYVLNVNQKTHDTLFIETFNRLGTDGPDDIKYRASNDSFFVGSVKEGTDYERWIFFSRFDTTVFYFENCIAVNLQKNYIVGFNRKYYNDADYDIYLNVIDIYTRDTLQSFKIKQLRNKFFFIPYIIDINFFEGNYLVIKWAKDINKNDHYDLKPGSYSKFLIQI